MIKISCEKYGQVLGKVPIKEKPINYFTPVRFRYGGIGIGIIDQKYLYDENSSWTNRK